MRYLFIDAASHLLDPRSKREFAFDMPVDGENAIGEEKPDRGSAAEKGRRQSVNSQIRFDEFKVINVKNVCT